MIAAIGGATGSQWPLCIAHRGGNNRRAMRDAVAAGADWLETDIWLHYGRLVARHDPAIWRLPITYHARGVRLDLSPTLVLTQVLAVAARADRYVLIDLKGTAPRLPHTLARLVQRRKAIDRVALCGQDWDQLDAAAAIDPAIRLVYSVGSDAQLRQYVTRAHDGTAPTTVSCYHTLLTQATTHQLKDAGVTIIAWTVDSYTRAQDLLAWGVDGITSNNYAMFTQLRQRSTPRC